ncbi:MAG: fumarate reductase [Betaproteobacteria bacterium RIFCSPLOWO2_02_FULL_67_26]|nr:MAG: fumarate reductase [Betaproteobacteria bacterium RIFCSPLOWO2_02_FULL_67_26]
MRFDESTDVVVAGSGLAGGIAAITAADAGAKVLLIEKSEVPGGLSICSYGAVRSARDPQAAFAYLQATNDGRTPDDVLRVLAGGMCELEAAVRELAKINGAVISTSVAEAAGGGPDDPERRRVGANYPFPGNEAFYHTTVVDVPGFDAAGHYPWANGAPGGPKLYKIIHDHLRKRGVETRLATPALRLIAEPGTREVRGVEVAAYGAGRAIQARRGVVLACGGFEGNAEMKAQFLEGKPVYNAAARTNTGDGIRMAQDLGAALWHMWHIHGAYGFRHPDPAYPYAIRLKRFPDWFPGEEGRARVKMAWILLDQDGRRFMSEYQPYTQDTGVRPMQHYDPVRQRFPRNPAFMICDEEGRKQYPLGKATSNDKGIRYTWSDDNLKEVGLGVLKRADTLEGLAIQLGLEPEAVVGSVSRWNEQCGRGRDEDYGRPGGTMTSVTKPPFYGAPVWATMSNTQGGPVHDAQSRVIDVYGKPIPRLYAAGELGSAFGHLYLSGGNIAECFVTGRVAGRGAAGLKPWDD